MGLFDFATGEPGWTHNTRKFDKAVRAVLSPSKRKGLNNFLLFSRCLGGYGEVNIPKDAPRGFCGIPSFLGDMVHALSYVYSNACEWHTFYFIRKQEYNPFYHKWNPCVTDDEVIATIQEFQTLGVYGAGELIMRRIGVHNMPMRVPGNGL